MLNRQRAARPRVALPSADQVARADSFGGGIAGLLQMPEVQREVELTDEQKTELGKLRTEIRDQIRNQMSSNGMRDLSDEERAARFEQIRTQMDTIRKDVEAKLQKVLLPNQFDRLKQIDLQSRVQREGAAALTSSELADQLGLTDDQKEQIQQKADQLQQDLQAKIRQAGSMPAINCSTSSRPISVPSSKH